MKFFPGQFKVGTFVGRGTQLLEGEMWGRKIFRLKRVGFIESYRKIQKMKGIFWDPGEPVIKKLKTYIFTSHVSGMTEFHIKDKGEEFVESLEAKFPDPEKFMTASKRCQ